jgi:hypothetical protein
MSSQPAHSDLRSGPNQRNGRNETSAPRQRELRPARPELTRRTACRGEPVTPDTVVGSDASPDRARPPPRSRHYSRPAGRRGRVARALRGGAPLGVPRTDPIPAGRRPCSQVSKPQNHIIPHWLPSSRGAPRRGTELEQFSSFLGIRRLPIPRTGRWLGDLWLRAWDLRNSPRVTVHEDLIGANGGQVAAYPSSKH